MIKLYKKTISEYGHVKISILGIKILSFYDKQIYCKNNNINIPKSSNIKLFIRGENNRVEVGDFLSNVTIHISFPEPYLNVNNCQISIGKNCVSNGIAISICENNTNISIGNDCLFSWGIQIWGSDTHSVLDKDNKVINIGRYIHIGNHVWIGHSAVILKNTFIADNCIIGAGSVVSGRFEEPGCVIAGNPAKVVKRGINWDIRRPQQYLEDTK